MAVFVVFIHLSLVCVRVRSCVRAFVRSCVRAFVRSCVRAFVRSCVRVCAPNYFLQYLSPILPTTLNEK